MITKPYLTVPEISQRQDMSTRQVRNILRGLNEFGNESMIYKDHNGSWQVLNSLERYFKRKRAKGKRTYYALSFDIPKGVAVDDIHEMMLYAFELVDDPDAEIHYVVEMKKKNIEPHIHSYYKCASRKRMKEAVNTAFSGTNYHQAKVFDLEGWKGYMTKDGLTITTIKNQKDEKG